MSRPKPDHAECKEHKSKTERLVPTKDHGSGMRWQVRWRDMAGKQVKENFAKKTDADKRANDVESDLRRGRYVDPKLGRQSFAAAAQQWAKNAPHRPSTAARVERAMRIHILPILGHLPIAGIQRSDIQGWVKDRTAVLAPSTLGVNYSYIVSVFKLAEFDNIIGTNPCKKITLPEDVRPEAEPLPLDVVEALIEAVYPRYRALLKLAAGSGLRQGELFALEVEHINFLKREVRVRQQFVHPDEGGPSYLSAPKTKQSYRTVPLAKSIIDELAAHLAEFPARTVLVDDRTDPRKPVERPARLVFTNSLGKPIQRGAWSKTWESAVRKADAFFEKSGSDTRVPDEATMHGFRHFFASVLIAARESVKIVQKRMGHAKPSITLDTYSHLWPDAEDTSREAVEAVFGSSARKVPSASTISTGAQVRRIG
ncbi:site-specific integrase [Actinospica durhamensis]|uniref:Site-specific integrase n=1 Tax=Actinospica durhamensis TaxID=1508375 RepID=A0A941IRQ1_9ACTN|nr:site-specific integrase [Actinospica durhamensis]MBR7832496.1 site-specific integrase [Actinospica durhamensis]